MPTNNPSGDTKAPPLFPGFTAASVWINDSNGNTLLDTSPLNMLMLLAFALTIPAVTVEVKLKGLPTAKTQSPISILSELPNSV